MKKAIIINDELGTIALGFSKSGYEIGAIYIDYLQKNAVNICKSNWGDLVYTVNWNDCLASDFIDADFIAGKIPVCNFSVDGNRKRRANANNCILKIVELLKVKQPSLFFFQCNRANFKNKYFYEEVIKLGYQVGSDEIDVRNITGFPVNEREYFIYGALNSNGITLEALKDIYTANYPANDFYEAKYFDDKWYSCVNPHFLRSMKRENYGAILCWNKKYYEEAKYVSWNPRMIPLLAQGDNVRKVTHKEIARLKGIPDEYCLDIKNKNWLYQKLMYCANVQVIQQMISAISFDMGERSFQSRTVSKGLQFENILKTYFDNKKATKINSNKNIDSIVDFQIETENGVFPIVLKFYSSNVGVEAKILTICERLLSEGYAKSKNCILIVGNLVDREFEIRIKQDYNIYIWDVKNLLWLFDEFPQIRSEFIALLSYTISDIKPQSPEPNIFEQKFSGRYNADLQERLRKIRHGKEEARKYEKLCGEIIRYIFSDDLEFFEEQKESNDELYRFDYCGKIKHGKLNEFFNTIQNFFNTKYIIFEFKNYSSEITQKEIYTTEKYLYEKALRKVAVIISRKGADANAHKAIRGCLRENGKLIICLSDEDINNLIDIKSTSGVPGDMLEAMLDDMLMDLEK